MKNHLHVVIGAGSLGTAVAQELLARGHQVRVVNRRGQAPGLASAEVVRGNATDPASMREVCQSAAVVYHCANVPYAEWSTTLPAMMHGVITGAATAGATLVYGDNLYMYGPVAGALTEDLPYAAEGRKGRIRANVATLLLTAHAEGRIRGTIGRASHFYGPGVSNSVVGERIFRAALAGKPAELLGVLDVPHTYTYIDDFARGLVTLGEREEAWGETWHIPSAPTLTTREFIAMIYAEANTAPRFRVAPKRMVQLLALFNATMREFVELLYEFEQPFVVDHSKYARVFGSTPTPHPEAIRITMDWCRAQANNLAPAHG